MDNTQESITDGEITNSATVICIIPKYTIHTCICLCLCIALFSASEKTLTLCFCFHYKHLEGKLLKEKKSSQNH